MGSLISKKYQNFIAYVTKNDSDELTVYLKNECEPWYTISGSRINIRTVGGQIIFFPFFILMMTVFIFHSVFGAVTSALAYSCNLEYACIIGYITVNGFWAASIFYMQFIRRPNFSLVYVIIRKNFFTYDSEPSFISPDRENIKNMQLAIQKYIKYAPVVICVCDTLYMFFVPKLQCDNPLLEDDLIFPGYHPVTANSGLSIALKNFFEVFFLFGVIVINCAGLFFFVNSAFHIIVQLWRLVDSINAIEERALRIFLKKSGQKCPDHFEANLTKKMKLFENSLYIDCYHFCLKENIQHHQKIITFQYHFQQSCEVPMGVILSLCSVLIALLLLMMFDDTFFGSFLVGFCLLSITFVGLYLASTIGQYFLDLAEVVREAVYNIQWAGADRKITSLVSIIMEVSKKPIRPCVLGFLPYDRPGFLVIINAAYSYWNFLRLLQSIRS